MEKQLSKDQILQEMEELKVFGGYDIGGGDPSDINICYNKYCKDAKCVTECLAPKKNNNDCLGQQ